MHPDERRLIKLLLVRVADVVVALRFHSLTRALIHRGGPTVA